MRHFIVTTHPAAMWTARQLVESSGTARTSRYLIRDGDAIYGNRFLRQIKALGIDEVITSPGSSWQNAYAQRVIGSIRRECLDHVIVWENVISNASYHATYVTITARELIYPWTRMRPMVALSNHQCKAR